MILSVSDPIKGSADFGLPSSGTLTITEVGSSYQGSLNNVVFAGLNGPTAACVDVTITLPSASWDVPLTPD